MENINQNIENDFESTEKILKKSKVDSPEIKIKEPIQEFKESLFSLNTLLLPENEEQRKKQNFSNTLTAFLSSLYVSLCELRRNYSPEQLNLFSVCSEEEFNNIFQTLLKYVYYEPETKEFALDLVLILLEILSFRCVNQKLNQDEYIQIILDFSKNYLEKSCEIISQEKDIKKIQKKQLLQHQQFLQYLIMRTGQLLDTLILFFQSTILDSSFLVSFVSISLDFISVLFFENGKNLQLSCMGLIKTIFLISEDLRSLILDDFFNLVGKLPIKGNNLRTFNGPTNIQISTALFLTFIQVSTLPSIHSFPEPEKKNIKKTTTKKSNSKKEILKEEGKKKNQSFENAIFVSKSFLSNLFQRCSTKEFEAEYKPILENLISDLLSVFNHPEFPAAELCLNFCLTFVSHYLSKNDQIVLKEKENSISPSWKNFCMEILGQILCKLRSESNLTKEIISKKLSRSIEEKKTNDNENLACDCGKIKETSLCIDCNLCGNWYHTECVKISSHNVPSVWFCDFCQILKFCQETNLRIFTNQKKEEEKKNTTKKTKKITTKKKKIEKEEEEPEKEDEETKLQQSLPELNGSVLKILLLDELSLLAKENDLFLESRSFFISSWCYNENKNEEDFQISYRNFSSLTRNALLKIIQTLNFNNKNSILSKFVPLLNLILTILNSSSTPAGLRKKSMQTLSQIINTDSKILLENSIKNTIHEQLNSPSVSVRESTLELVGNYLLEKPELVSNYLNLIISKLTDSGLAVRKRVVKILSEICWMDVTSQRCAELSVLLLSCPKEESTIASLIHSHWEDLLFKSFKFKNQNQIQNNNNNNKKQKGKKQKEKLSDDEQDDKKQDKKQIEHMALIILNIVSSRAYNSQKESVKDMLQKVIMGDSNLPRKSEKKILKQLSDEKNTKYSSESTLKIKSKKTIKLIDQLCQHFISNFLNYDDNRAESKEEEEASIISRQLLSCLTCLLIIGSISPQSTLPAVTCFAPYLKINKETTINSTIDILILEKILQVLSICFPHCFWVDNSILFTEIEMDLVQLIFTQNTTITRSAVSSLCELEKIKQDPSFLEKFLYRYYSQIVGLRKKFSSSDKNCSIPPENKRILARALFVVGLLMKHFDFLNNEEEENYGETSLEKFIKNCADYIFQEFQFFYQSSDADIKDMSLQGIGTLIHIPSVMQRATPILKDCLTTGSIQSKVSNLKSLADYFKETAFSDDENGTRNKLAQTFLPKILLLLSDSSPSVRQMAISLSEIYVKHGLLNPIDFLEPLLSLCLVDFSNFSFAFSIVKLIEFKKPQVHKRIVEGLKKSCEIFKMPNFTQSFNNVNDINGNKKNFYGNFHIIFDLVNLKKRVETLHLLLKLLENEKDFNSFKFFAKCITMLELSEEEKKIFTPQLERIISLNYSLKEKDTDFSILTCLFYLKKNIKCNEKDLKVFDQIETGKKQSQIFEKLYESDEKSIKKVIKKKTNNNENNDETENSENLPLKERKSTTANKKKMSTTKKTAKYSKKKKKVDSDDENYDMEDEDFQENSQFSEKKDFTQTSRRGRKIKNKV